MNNVNPIDTEYNGYKFRSRLEARWAIFFDQLNLRYLYEPEGFDLNGVRYLPDFQLPSGIQIQGEATARRNVWVEIKPAGELKEEDREKVAAFVKQTDNQVLLIAGDPGPDAPIRFIHHSQKENWFAPQVQFVELENGKVGLAKLEKGAAPAANGRTPTLLAAYKAARQARFEHGAERPAEQVPTTKKCNECGRPFIPQQNYHNLCQDCFEKQLAEQNAANRKGRSQSTPVTRTCEGCGKSFRPYRSHHYLCRSCYRTRKKEKRSPAPKWVPAALYAVAIALVAFAAISIMLWRPFQVEEQPAAAGGASAEPTQLVVPTETAVPTATPEPSPTPVEAAACNCERNMYDCADFVSQVEAQACFDSCLPTAGDIHFLDSNDDGEACESLP